MQTNVLLPQVELTMESALIARWLVKIGDHVSAQQPLLEVETQKATSDIPSPVVGYVRLLCVEAGQTVNEKALLCVITETADEAFEAAGAAPTAQKPAASQTAAAASAPVATASDGPVKASPVARKLAKELGVELSNVAGSGPGGRITEDDVRKAAGSSGSGASQESWTPLPASRVALIELMRKSLAEIPQIHVNRHLDVTPLSVKTEGITFTHRLVVATAAALAKHPALRTTIDGNRIKVEPVSVAIAMDLPTGLLAPVVRDADRLTLEQVAVAVKSLRTKAETGALHRADLSDAPFAITNLGMLGVDQFDAFVFHGQTAVLSIGRATDDAAGRKRAWFGLAADHRIVDGAEAARFLETLQTEILR